MIPQRKLLGLAVLLLAAALAPGVAQGQAACFARNCNVCNPRNPYVCKTCAEGYVLTSAQTCNSCAPDYEQNLDERTFVCVKCPPGFTSPGGTGEASQCTPITVTSARRLFAAEDDLWV